MRVLLQRSAPTQAKSLSVFATSFHFFYFWWIVSCFMWRVTLIKVPYNNTLHIIVSSISSFSLRPIVIPPTFHIYPAPASFKGFFDKEVPIYNQYTFFQSRNCNTSGYSVMVVGIGQTRESFVSSRWGYWGYSTLVSWREFSVEFCEWAGVNSNNFMAKDVLAH